MGTGRLRMAGAVCGGRLHVFSRAGMVAAGRRNFCRGTVCSQPLPPGHRLLAKCVRGVAGQCLVAPLAALRSARRPMGKQDYCTALPARGHGVADQCTLGGDGELFARAVGGDFCDCASLSTNSALRRSGSRDWCGTGIVLFVAGGLRGEVGKYSRGALARSSPAR